MERGGDRVIYAGLAAAAGLGAGLLARSRYERSHFVTERFRVQTEKLPEGMTRNLVFLSDLHDNTFGPENEKLLEAIFALEPDAVLIGGDMMVSRGEADLTVTLNLVRRLAARFPVFYGNGNHEARLGQKPEVFGDRSRRLEEGLRAAGAWYLPDKSADLDRYIRITGCDLAERYYRHHFTVPKLPEGEIAGRVGEARKDKYQILLLHSPLFFENSRKWGADLTLCGHFHGGTIRIPGLGGVMTPQYQFFLPCCAGRFDRDGKTMLVSRGLGTHSINLRLNNRPQLVWITLEGRQSLQEK